MNYETDFAPLMKRMIAAFPQRPISADTVAVYWEMLSDLDAPIFTQSVKRCMESCEWFPTIKHLRHAAEDIIMESIPDPYEAMCRFPHRVKNPMIRALVSTKPEEYDAIARDVQSKNNRPFQFSAPPRRLRDGKPDA
jgi:hypothetical protein